MILEVQILFFLPIPFFILFTISFSFSLVTLFFYLVIPVTAPTVASTVIATVALTTVPIEAFAEASIITLATIAPTIASSTTTALTIALVIPAILACWPAIILIFNNNHSSIKRRKRRGKIIYNSIRGKRSHKEISTPYIVRVSSFIDFLSPLLNWPTPALLSNVKSNSNEEKPKKKLGAGIKNLTKSWFLFRKVMRIKMSIGQIIEKNSDL